MTDRGPVEIELDMKHRPVGFVWQGRKYRVRSIQECWRLMGAWWNNQGEQTYFRVQADSGGVYELCFDHAASKWKMHNVCD